MAAGEITKKYQSELNVVQVYSPYVSLAPATDGQVMAYDPAATSALIEATFDAVSRRT